MASITRGRKGLITIVFILECGILWSHWPAHLWAERIVPQTAEPSARSVQLGTPIKEELGLTLLPNQQDMLEAYRLARHHKFTAKSLTWLSKPELKPFPSLLRVREEFFSDGSY